MTMDTAEISSSSVDAAVKVQSELLQIVEEAAAQIANQASPSDRILFLLEATPLFSDLRAISRSIHDSSRRGKRKVAETRVNVDERSLALQNLKYQKRHLEEEIRTCRDFRSIYQTIPLTDLDDFKARASAEDTTEDILLNPHHLQLARLRFELSERKRLEAEKQAIQAHRGTLIKENKDKKQKLEELERYLKDMVGKSQLISQQFESEPSEESLASAGGTQSANTPVQTEIQAER